MTYDISKTKTVLFVQVTPPVITLAIIKDKNQVGIEKIIFNKIATRWLGVLPNSQLKFISHINEKRKRIYT